MPAAENYRACQLTDLYENALINTSDCRNSACFFFPGCQEDSSKSLRDKTSEEGIKWAPVGKGEKQLGDTGATALNNFV